MPKEATGTVYQRDGRFGVRVTLGPKIPLPACSTRPVADKRVAIVAKLAADKRGASVPREFIERTLRLAGERADGKPLDEVIEAAKLLCKGEARAEAPERTTIMGQSIASAPARPGVYFVRQGETGPITIGVAGDVRRRLSQLQTSHADRLVLLAVLHGAGEIEEQALHARFADLRHRGEWFAHVRALQGAEQARRI